MDSPWGPPGERGQIYFPAVLMPSPQRSLEIIGYIPYDCHFATGHAHVSWKKQRARLWKW